MTKSLDQITKLIDRRTSGMPTAGAIVRIDGGIVDITLGAGSGVIRNVDVQGSTDLLTIGQVVPIQWVQRQGGYLAPMIIAGSGTYISSAGETTVDHVHPSELEGAGFVVGNGIIGTMISMMSGGQFRAGNGSNLLVISGTDPNYRMWLGAELPASASFKISLNGELHAIQALLTSVDQPFQSIPTAPPANTARMFVNQDGHLCVLNSEGIVTDFTLLAGGVTDHGQLYGLSDDDHPQYLQRDTDQTITAQHTIDPPTAKPPFVLGTNARNQLVTGLNAEKLGGYTSSQFATASHSHPAADYIDLPQIGAPYFRDGYHRLHYDQGGQLWDRSYIGGDTNFEPVAGVVSLTAGAAGGNSLVTFDFFSPMGYVGWMPATGTSSLYWNIAAPRNWNGRQLRAKIFFAITENSLASVRWKFSLGRIHDGAVFGGEHYYEYVTSTVPAKNYIMGLDFYYIPPVAVDSGDCGLSVRIARVGSDISDTCPYSVGVLMAIIQPMPMN